VKYKCPYCGKVIGEVEVIMLTWKRVGLAVGLGVGCGLLVYPLMPESLLVGAIGAFLIGFVVAFLLTKEKLRST